MYPEENDYNAELEEAYAEDPLAATAHLIRQEVDRSAQIQAAQLADNRAQSANALLAAQTQAQFEEEQRRIHAMQQQADAIMRERHPASWDDDKWVLREVIEQHPEVLARTGPTDTAEGMADVLDGAYKVLQEEAKAMESRVKGAEDQDYFKRIYAAAEKGRYSVTMDRRAGSGW